MRFVAVGICLALGVGAGLGVGTEIAEVFAEPRWLPWAAGGGTGIVVFVVLYVPLLRPIAEALGDRLAALRQSTRATRTGSGLDDIPVHRDGQAPPVRR
ncbi:MAG: hypothetical protein M0R80_31045 [Proteobacteria bacterium]|jgi:hypothetical protein|nr:hypothetical protein [Pseudomonadota bacterium]